MTNKDITPQEVVKLMETNPNLTSKERAKGLALALTRILNTAIEIKIAWEFSMYVAKFNGFEIPKFDPQFVVAINENPKAFVDYV